MITTQRTTRILTIDPKTGEAVSEQIQEETLVTTEAPVKTIITHIDKVTGDTIQTQSTAPDLNAIYSAAHKMGANIPSVTTENAPYVTPDIQEFIFTAKASGIGSNRQVDAKSRDRMMMTSAEATKFGEAVRKYKR